MTNMDTTQPSEQPLDLSTLSTFTFDRVLSENTMTGSVFLLGTLHGSQAILHVQRTLLSSTDMPQTIQSGLDDLNVFLDNRPYFSAHALVKRTKDSAPDLQIKAIWPCTEDHIRKYTSQERRVFKETARVYTEVVVPYVDSFPPSRTDWVLAILDGRKEAERVLYRDEDERFGFVIIPDLKWDEVSMNALVIARDAKIRSLRDLKKEHIPMLREIQTQAKRAAKEKYGVDGNLLRIYVHYQPSYYHFHVHVVHIYHENTGGMLVGSAHLVEDLISLLELSEESPKPTLLAKMTLTYTLGAEHKLYPLLLSTQGFPE